MEERNGKWKRVNVKVCRMGFRCKSGANAVDRGGTADGRVIESGRG